MKYVVEVTDRALADLDRLTESLIERSPDRADRLTKLFLESLTRLESFPHSCGRAYESRFVREEIRHLLFGFPNGRDYCALFKIEGERVIVIAIRAPGERPRRKLGH